MRKILITLNVLALIILGVVAKDNIVANLEPWPKSQSVASEGSIEVVFSPNNGATATIVKALAQAKKSILVSAYSFTSKELAQALLAAKRRQVAVKVILDKSQVSQRYSSATFFKNQDFDLKFDIKHAIFHNKIMIIDDVTVITGSFNFTKAAETKNAENVLIIRNNKKLAHLYSQNWWFHWHQSVSWDDFLSRRKNDKSLSSKHFKPN